MLFVSLNYSFNCDRSFAVFNNWLFVDGGHGPLRLVELAEQLSDIRLLFLTRETEFGIKWAADAMLIHSAVLLFFFTDKLQLLLLLFVNNFLSVGIWEVVEVRYLIFGLLFRIWSFQNLL